MADLSRFGLFGTIDSAELKIDGSRMGRLPGAGGLKGDSRSVRRTMVLGTVVQRNGLNFLYDPIDLENDEISDRAPSFAKTNPSFVSGASDLRPHGGPVLVIECDDSI